MNALQYDDMRLVNFRVPNHLRVKFNMICQFNHSTMTKELTSFISSYITEESFKVEHMGVRVSTKDITNNTHIKPAQKTKSNDGWGQTSKTTMTPSERWGELIKNPSLKLGRRGEDIGAGVTTQT